MTNLKRVLNWLLGIPAIEAEVDELLKLREQMSPAEWLDIAAPYYDELGGKLDA